MEVFGFSTFQEFGCLVRYVGFVSLFSPATTEVPFTVAAPRFHSRTVIQGHSISSQRSFRPVLAFASLLLPWMATAQSSVEIDSVLQTTPGQELASSQQAIASMPGPFTSVLQFVFGFSTDETVELGGFLDSATVTLRDVNGEFSAVIGTLDRSGSYWAPFNPGGLTLEPSSIVREETAFPDLDPLHDYLKAYEVSFTIPEEMRGLDLVLHFDLFNNQNSSGSLGWISKAVVVPEPGTGLLVFAGILFLFGLRWRQER